MKIKYKYAVYKDDMLYDYFDTMKQAESFLSNLPPNEHIYYWYIKKFKGIKEL